MNADLTAPLPSVFAVVAGKPFTDMPVDLFIPPDALEILLDSFSGPLDLLLYLIRKQNLDILNIPIANITQQYMQYIHIMEEHRLELAADYLVMAAMLAEIKSRLLLPPSANQQDEIESDPRQELVRKLLAYEQIKHAAVQIDNLPRSERELFRFAKECQQLETVVEEPCVELGALTAVMRDLLKRQSHLINHQISREPLSIRERMAIVLERLHREKNLRFSQLLKRVEERMGLTVTLLAVLELARQSLLILNQADVYSMIYLQAANDD